MNQIVTSAVRWSAAWAALAAAAYVAYVGSTWYRYGRPSPPSDEDADPLLDRFLPAYDVVERRHVRVSAPAALTLEVAREIDLFQLPVVRAIFKGREILLGSDPDDRPRPRGVVEATRRLGWVVLDERPGREIVMGAVTKPWKSNVTFRSIAPERFAAFAEPDYVKIVWTLRADPIGESSSMFRSETRAVATDQQARRQFRWYWAFLSPGIIAIRRLMLGPVKAAAERRARAVTCRRNAVA